jgi:hypothetical protein
MDSTDYFASEENDKMASTTNTNDIPVTENERQLDDTAAPTLATTTTNDAAREHTYEIFRETKDGASILNRFCLDANTKACPFEASLIVGRRVLL